VAASIENLLPLMTALAQTGAKNVLVEKPVALASADLEHFIGLYPHFRAQVALNRLYFPSVAFMRQRLRAEPLTSLEFSFTEWIHRIDTSAFSRRELARWGLSNCIHVIATAFDIAGMPLDMCCHVGGSGLLSWHPSGCIFVGAGTTRSGTPFCYGADWTSAGRWSITLRTTEGSYQLAPMEEVRFTPRGSITTQVLVPMHSGDVKCGFREMLEAFLHPARAARADLETVLGHLRVIEKMFNYHD
jgi:predicted dehydrogenase